MEAIRRVTESLARKTTRRSLFSRGAQVATGALIGAAVGQVSSPRLAAAGGGTVCQFPGPPCPCDGCNSQTGACAKPAIFVTVWYASGCWVTTGTTCCDCDYPPYGGYCGCGTDYHTANC